MHARMGKSYLFAEIAHRVAAFRKAHPGTGVIGMGIGEATQPLVPSVIRALHTTVDDMGSPDSFLAVPREESVTGAANFLHVTQPTLSR